MKPILYNGNETDFTGNGIAVLAEALSCEVREVRNGEFELTLEYPVDGPWFKEIIEQRIVRAKPNDKDDLHNFRIYNVNKTSSGESVVAQAATLSNDLGGNLVKYLRVDNGTAQSALNAMKLNLVEPTTYNFVSDISTLASTTWEMRNPLNCIVGEEGSLVDIWGGEVKRTDTTIYLYSRRGLDKVTRIRPRKGMTGFSMKTSVASVVTRVQPFAVYRDEKTDQEITLIGTIVESPRKGNYAFSRILPVQYTENADGTPITTTTQLNALAKNYFTENPNIDKPKVEITADLIALADTTFYDKFKKLETIGLTDTIEVYVPKYDIDVELKITELVYNVLTEQVISLKAGDTSSTFYQSNKYEYGYEVNQLKKYIYTVENGLRNYVQISADGKNTIFRGYTEPDKSISHEGDLWFKEVGNGEQEIWIFDGSYWQPIVTAGINEELAAKLAEAQVAIDAAEQNLADAQAELANVSQATTAAQAAADQALAAGNDAKAKVEQAQQDIINLDSKVGTVTIDVGSALQNAAAAQQKATDALTSATSAMNKATAVESTTQDLVVSIDGVTSRMTSIETTNQQNVQKINEVSLTVDGMTQTLATVESTANSALSKTNTLTTSVDSMNLTLTSVQESIRNVDYANYVPNSKGDSTKGYSAWGYTNYTSDGTSINITRGSSGVTFGVQTEYLIDNIVAGSEYTLQLDIKSSNLQSLNYVFIMYSDSKGNLKLPETEIDPTKGDFQTITIPFTPTRSDKVRILIAFNIAPPNAAATEFSVKNIMVSKGGINARSWQPAIVDLATDTKVNTISTTVDSHTQLIASTKTTADSALTKANSAQSTADGNTTKITAVTTTANSALSKATSVEQTANGLTTTVTSIQNDLGNLDISGENLIGKDIFHNKITFIQAVGIKTQVGESQAPDGIASKITLSEKTGSYIFYLTTFKNSPIRDFIAGKQYVLSFQIKATKKISTVSASINEADIGKSTFREINTGYEKKYIVFTPQVSSPNAANMNFHFFTTENIVGVDIFIHSVKLEEGNFPTGFGIATASQFTQLSDQIDLRVQKNGVINAINVSTEGVVIAGNKITITGTTTIATGVIKTAHIADANISTAKIADLAVATAKIGDLAVTNAKIANLAVTAAKIANATITNAEIALATILGANIANATITDAKIGSLSASKITTGTLNASNVNVINLNASNITSGTISGANLSINLATGSVLFSKGKIANIDNTFYIDIDNDTYYSEGYTSASLANKAVTVLRGGTVRTAIKQANTTERIEGVQIIGNGAIRSYVPKDAASSLNLTDEIYNSNYQMVTDLKVNHNTSGSTRYGNFGVELYKVASGGTPSLTDMPYLQMNGVNSTFKVYAVNKIDLVTNETLTLSAKRTDINGGGDATTYGGITFGRDGTSGRVWSMAIYNRTYSSASNMFITSAGTLGRATSARKYKEDIQVAEEVISKAKRLLSILPSSWYDKAEIARGGKAQRYYGFVADDFDNEGLKEVVSYGDSGQVEGLAYDRLTMYQNVILSDHEREIQSLKNEVDQLKNKVKELEAA